MSRKITMPFQTLVTEQQNLWKANMEFQGFSTCITDNSQTTMSEIKGPLQDNSLQFLNSIFNFTNEHLLSFKS